jgi:iron complex transport system substrate-binding protein
MVTVLLAALLLIAGGCAKKPEPTEAVADGRLRIVSMAPNLTEILFALGLDEEIVGVTRHCNYPPQALTKPQVGTFWQPDIEAVLAARPALVVTLSLAQQRPLAEQLDRIGCAVLTVEDFESLPQLYDGILAIGQAVGRTEQAEAMAARVRAGQEAMLARYAGPAPPKVLWVIQRQPLRVAGTKTFVNEMIEAVGGVNAIGATVNVYPPISAEDVIAAWPDVIIEPANMPDLREVQARSAETFYAAFRRVPAVKNGRVYVLDGDLVSRLGPRLDEGLDAIARCVWQEQR